MRASAKDVADQAHDDIGRITIVEIVDSRGEPERRGGQSHRGRVVWSVQQKDRRDGGIRETFRRFGGPGRHAHAQFLSVRHVHMFSNGARQCSASLDAATVNQDRRAQRAKT